MYYANASKLSYGCVAYLREELNDSIVKVSFTIAKGRVAPVRPMSIQRPELLGALLSARMVNKLMQVIDFPIKSMHFYTDKMSVLGWVSSDPERWKPFVANRIRRIHQLIGQADRCFVSTKINPADSITRGNKISTDDIWLKGPPMLHLNNVDLSVWKERNRPAGRKTQNTELDIERKLSVRSYLVSNSAEVASRKIFFENSFSCFLKAIRFWAYMKRLRQKSEMAIQGVKQNVKCSPRNRQTFQPASSEDMINARIDLLKLMQKTYFHDEYNSECKSLKKSSVLRTYAPSMDNGLIRCKSRLEYSSLSSNEMKAPIIIPSEGLLTKLPVRFTHERKCLHFGGVAAILHRLREEFLVLKARKLAREVVAACPTCRIFNARNASPQQKTDFNSRVKYRRR